MTPRSLARRFPWLSLALALVGCKGSRPTPSPSPPSLDWLPGTVDLGRFAQDEAAHATVRLRNNSPAAVRLTAASSSARCRFQDVPEPLPGHATVPLGITCRSDLLGPLREELSLSGRDQSIHLGALRIIGRVEPLLGFDTGFVDLRPAFGRTATAEIRLVGKYAARARPRIVDTGGAMLTAQPVAGRPTAFQLSCSGDRVGMHAGSLTLETGIPEPATLTLSWGCRVPGTLEVDPTNPYFNLRASGDRATTILVRGERPGFRVRAATITEGPFRASVGRPGPDGRWPITVQVLKNKIPPESRTATGTLVIHSNDAREPRKAIPLFGFGKVNLARP